MQNIKTSFRVNFLYDLKLIIIRIISLEHVVDIINRYLI